MALNSRSTRSNTNLDSFEFPEETPDLARHRRVSMQNPAPQQPLAGTGQNVQIQPPQQPPAAPANQVNVNPVQPAANNSEEWCINPLTVDYNPGTRTGQEIFKNKTRGLPDAEKFQVLSKEAPALRKLLISKSATLGGILTRVPIGTRPDGTVLYANLVEQHNLFDFETLQRQAIERYGTPLAHNAHIPEGPWQLHELLNPKDNPVERKTFYNRVHSEAVTAYLTNILTPTGYAKVIGRLLDQMSFVCPRTGSRHIDGPCLLFLLWDRIDPSLAVNVENLRADIEKIRLHNYENNVDLMLTEIEEKYQKILSMDATCESIIRHSLNALTSGPDHDFNIFVKGIKANVDSGTGAYASITFNQLVAATRKYYQNQVAQGQYGKVDPRNAQLMTLMTKIDKLEGDLNKKNATALGTATGPTGGDGRNRAPHGNDTPGLDMTFVEGTELYKWRISKSYGLGPVICHGRQY